MADTSEVIGAIGSIQDETDIRTIASFITGWWPLELRDSWDGTGSPKHPVLDAVTRVRHRRNIR